jgi:hypothetical protein
VHAVPGARALVGGQSAVSLDVARASAHDRDLLLPLILAVVLVILAILLRALVAPLILTATVVLSFAAALGVSAFFFNHVFGFGGADTTFPLLVFVFLVALGIDYNIFLMTRVREEAHRRDARRGAITGLAATGGVITSAGLVLAGTFAVLATIPATFLTELGFAVAFGILLDTIVVRLLLVTALNLDVGRRMWWPSRLARKPDPAPAELSHERASALTKDRLPEATAGGRRHPPARPSSRRHCTMVCTAPRHRLGRMLISEAFLLLMTTEDGKWLASSQAVPIALAGGLLAELAANGRAAVDDRGRLAPPVDPSRSAIRSSTKRSKHSCRRSARSRRTSSERLPRGLVTNSMSGWPQRASSRFTAEGSCDRTGSLCAIQTHVSECGMTSLPYSAGLRRRTCAPGHCSVSPRLLVLYRRSSRRNGSA